jgi:hypothetical protein
MPQLSLFKNRKTRAYFVFMKPVGILGRADVADEERVALRRPQDLVSMAVA